ncbi:MAG: SAM-dependent methyltransferase, partial [Treponema sp.]|nr:SAM-dependent methyltransferase [Treponema sp.]
MSVRLGLRINANVNMEKVLGWGDIEKALKYIKRWRGKDGKYRYLYPEDLLHPIKALKREYGLDDKKLTAEYTKNNIKKGYGVDKKTFAGHILEYFSNRFKWDNIFGNKENREKYGKPVKQKTVAAAAAVEKINGDDQPGLFKEKKPAASSIINRSLMKKVWEIYNPKKAQEAELEDKKIVDGNAQTGDTQSIQGASNGEDQSGIGQGELPAGTPAVRDGGSEGASDLNVSGAGAANNQGEFGMAADESGGSPGRGVRGKRGRSAIKDVREQVKKLLSEKTDSEMTEADKQLLRQYEGGGGLAEKDATTHGTLYEFYTPQKVVDKVWSLVDKYNPRMDKTVIEPSAGTGRFAENRQENFDLYELDETSARIARILHPDADVKLGYFQDLFMSGNTPKKSYTGKKYDVAIGNPPYGAYSGKHKGLGEGKEHTRIEEYFIDRSMDTLKDGGILAMVVPSSFLRSGTSKGKTKITSKARLLEAWRLPNGTFGTTGIGTDIIILRKEKGDTEAFNLNTYFETHEDQIVGDEVEKMGRFGMEKYVQPPAGMTFNEALDSINAGKVPIVQNGEISPVAQAVSEVKVSEAEEHENRSQSMMGNQNAKKLFFELLHTTLKTALTYDDVNEYETIDGGIGYVVTVKSKAAAQRTKSRWEKNGGYASFDENTGKLELSSTPLLGQNRSQAMMGNDNAAGDRGGKKEESKGRKKKTSTDDYVRSIGKNMSVSEYNEKYGVLVDKKDMAIWAETDYAGRIDVSQLSKKDKEHLHNSGNFTVDANGTWYSIANYASGNIYDKLDQLEKDKDRIISTMGEKVYQFNKSLLESAKLPPKAAENIHISPISDFVKEYKIIDDEDREINLVDTFKQWAGVSSNRYGRRTWSTWDADDSPI